MPTPDQPYDAAYYERRLGPRPCRTEDPVWRAHFAGLAAAIVERLTPARALDVGCAKGLLVEALRERGVEAFGVDVSSHAVAAAPAAVQPFLTVGDVRDLPLERYDVVTCLEVLEHLPGAEADAVLDALLARGAQVVFSSTPDDYDEPTHVNVRPVSDWVERFAARGYAPVPGVDLSSFAPHAMLFAPGEASSREQRLYADWVERGIDLVEARVRQGELEARAVTAEAELAELQETSAWRAAAALRAAREAVAPVGSRRQRALRRLAGRILGRARPGLGFDPEALRREPARPRLLIVSGCGGDSRRYRAEHLLEAAATLGGGGAVLEDDPASLRAAGERLRGCADVLVLHRARASGPLRRLVEAARRDGAPVVFDTDDLTFDPALDLAGVPGVAALLDREERAAQRAALELADVATCTNAFLAERLAASGRLARVLRNGWSEAMRRAAEAARRPPCTLRVMGYASGTPTHDADFAVCAGELAELLEADRGRELFLVGPLDPGARLARLGRRVRRRGLVPWEQLPRLLVRFDVNLAPLDLASPFCRAKSELKWLEAALVGVPTVASPAPAFAAAIEPGVDGVLAGPGEWRDAVEGLLSDPERARGVGERARAKVLAEYGPEARGRELAALLEDLGA